MSRPSTYYGNTSLLHQSNSHSTSTHTNTLQTRIASKRAELENLRELRDLSATLAAQMTALEQRLGTLRDGTEAVACVLANWQSVLGVIGMAGASAARLIPKEEAREDDESGKDVENEIAQQGEGKLPETLVRIPIENRGGKGETTVEE